MLHWLVVVFGSYLDRLVGMTGFVGGIIGRFETVGMAGFGGDLSSRFKILFSGFAGPHPCFGGGLIGGFMVLFGGFASPHPPISDRRFICYRFLVIDNIVIQYYCLLGLCDESAAKFVIASIIILFLI